LLSQIQAFKGKEPQHWRRYDKGLDSVMGPVVGHGIDSTVYSCATGTQATTARLLILEGWCVGLKAQQGSALKRSINTLEQHQDPDMQWRRHVNQQLAGDYQRIWQELQSLIWLQAPDWLAVCRWRGWQERALQQKGKGKTLAELEHFMLYFQRLTEESWRQLPDCADFILSLDQQHNFIRLTPDE
jgi:D-glycerate 3-kinase